MFVNDLLNICSNLLTSDYLLKGDNVLLFIGAPSMSKTIYSQNSSYRKHMYLLWKEKHRNKAVFLNPPIPNSHC